MNGLMGIKRFQTGGASKAPLVFAQSIAAGTAEDKARAYAQAIADGYTDAEIDKAITDQFYGGNANASAFHLAELERIAQPYISATQTTTQAAAQNTAQASSKPPLIFAQSLAAGTAEDKARAYAQAIADGYTDAEIDAAVAAQFYRGREDKAAGDLAELERIAQPFITGGTNTTNTGTTGGTTTTTTVTGGAGNDTLVNRQTFFAFGDPRYTWNTTDSLATKQDIVARMLADGFTVQQIRNEISRLEPDRSALTEANFQLLGLKLPTTTTTQPPPSNVNQTGLSPYTPYTPLSIGTPQYQAVSGLRQIAPENIDFSKLPAQLRFATPQTNLITQAARPSLEPVVRTLDAEAQRFGDRQAPLGAGQMSPGLRTAYEIGLGPSQYYQNIRSFFATNPNEDAIAAAKEQYGVSDVDIQRAFNETRAMQFSGPMTNQQKMATYVGDITAPDATLRGLQYVRNLGLNPEQATALWNQTYGTNFGPADYKRVMAEYGNLFGPAFERVPAPPATATTAVTGSPNLTSSAFTPAAGQPGAQTGNATYIPGQGIAGVVLTNTPDLGAGTPMPTPITETNLVGGQGTTPSIMFTPMGGNLVNLAGVGLDSTFPASTSRSEGILPMIIGEQKPAPIVTATPVPVPTEEEKQEQDNPTTEGKYAGGPVMGSPQYFEEGGEVEPMRKYTPTELGSTFDISEYIDPDTGRFMINEYRRDVVFGRGLEEAEAEARARMTPEEREMAMRDLMIRQGRTGREYGLPGITVGGAATGDIRPANYYYAKGGLADAARKGYAEELRQQGRNGDTILAHINPQEAAMLEAMGGSGTINPRTGLPEYGFSWKKLFKIGSMVLPFFGLPPVTTAIASGALAGASTPGKAFDFKRGLQVGLTSYMGAKAGEYLGKEMAARAGSSNLPGDAAFQAEVGLSAPPTTGQQIASALPDVSQYIPSTVTPTSVGQALGTASAQSAADEAIKIQQEQQAFFDEEERRRKRFSQVFQEGAGNIQPLVYARRGGLMALAGGGAIDPVGYEGGGMTAPVNQPRMLAGGGDGMSDSIPATIDGTQPARLADGEFVIPADVVADIGNGSSSAGAKRLYGMMDRVREARHGTTKQPPEIKMNRLMPA